MRIPVSTRIQREKCWARSDSNTRPTDYESR